MLGQVLLGKYRITRQLDEGGMSNILLARQTFPDREVVVKVLKDQYRRQTKAAEHFRREIFIMSRLEHPNALAVFDSAPHDPRGPILVMEYLRGTDLAGLMRRTGRFTPERTGRLLGQLCDVLGYVHQQGVIHRDLKPGNVMILYPGTPQETVKLMDFGLAKMSNMLYISPDEITDLGLPAASGTPEYISPEMVRGIEMDNRGDLYSVGVMLFEMLTGRRPFLHSGVEALLVAHANEQPPTFAEVGVTDVPPAVEAVVRSCLEKFPDRRPANATELALAYERAVGRRITATRGSAPGTISGLRPAVRPQQASGLRPAISTQQMSGLRPAVRPDAAASDASAVRHSIEATMPEAMALVKVKGFIYDLGGEVLESVPGMIRVRLNESQPKKSGGLFGWFDQGSRTATQAMPGSDIELHMERRDPANTGKLTITLVLRPTSGRSSPEWRERCGQISRDLQAYLMGR